MLKTKLRAWFFGRSKVLGDLFSSKAPSALKHWPQPSVGHVLVVDDQEVSRRIAGILLQSMGYRVSYAENGVQALALAKRGGFDLVLMDIHMPLMDGLTCARHIRALPTPCSLVPIVALTADLNDRFVKQAKMAGMQQVLSKPLQKSLLFPLMPEKNKNP